MNRVRYRGERFIVERGGKSICEILRCRTRYTFALTAQPDEEYLTVVEDVITKQPIVAEERVSAGSIGKLASSGVAGRQMRNLPAPAALETTVGPHLY
jgi:hypothetical protein